MFRVLFITLAIVLLPVGSALACAQPAGVQSLQSGLIGWINQQRMAQGLNRLAVSGKLAATAQGHACDMAERGYFGHQRAGGPGLGARLKARGFRYRTAAENIAKTRAMDLSAPAGVWQASPAHWANILKRDVTEIGMGIAIGGDGRTYWVMNIGRAR